MTGNKKKLSEIVWEEAQGLIDAIMALPFVKELAAGTLAKEKFHFYLQQDSIYLSNYRCVLAHIASRLKNQYQSSSFLKFALDCVAVEAAMHKVFLSDCGSAENQSPSNLLYCSLQKSQAMEPVEVEVASILPCFWVYLEVGKRISKMSKPDNPYSLWISTYSDTGFEESNNLAIEIFDQLAEQASTEVRERMVEMFLMCTKMEWMFWESAYNLEQWKI